MVKILTAGDSHGYALVGIVEGLPAHLPVNTRIMNEELSKRQRVYGRGKRMNIENDEVQILSGLWDGETTAAPLALMIKNRSTLPPNQKTTIPRPGHADFSGMLKYGFMDTRVITERASARRTAMDVAIGGIFKQLLDTFGIEVHAYTTAVGKVKMEEKASLLDFPLNVEEHPLLCPNERIERKMMAEIDEARKSGYTLGGKVEIRVKGLPVGLGTYNSYEERLTSVLAKSLFDIPSVKGLSYGDVEEMYSFRGDQSVDEFVNGKRITNHAGGLEGGMANGEELSISLTIKAVPTQALSVRSFDALNGIPAKTLYVRSDTCVVAAIAVIAEAKVATAIGRKMAEEFSAPTLEEMKMRVDDYFKRRGMMNHG